MATTTDKRRLNISRRIDMLILAEPDESEFRRNLGTLKRSLFASEITQAHCDALIATLTEMTQRGLRRGDDNVELIADLRRTFGKFS